MGLWNGRRNIYLRKDDSGIWEAAVARAKKEKISISVLIIKALQTYLKKNS